MSATKTAATPVRRRFGENFVFLWALAVIATASAFVLYLALRTRAVELGYRLGRVRARQAQLRETRRVLQLEAVAYRNPERVEKLAKGVLQLEEPPPQRIFLMGAPIEPTIGAKPASGKVAGVPCAAGAADGGALCVEAPAGPQGEASLPRIP